MSKLFDKMTDAELLETLQGYITRLNLLMANISKYLDGETDNYHEIREEYRNLKSEMKKDASYVRHKHNQNSNAKLYSLFSQALDEAATKGFTSKINASINQSFLVLSTMQRTICNII